MYGGKKGIPDFSGVGVGAGVGTGAGCGTSFPITPPMRRRIGRRLMMFSIGPATSALTLVATTPYLAWTSGAAFDNSGHWGKSCHRYATVPTFVVVGTHRPG